MLRWGELIERLKKASGMSNHKVASEERRKAVRVAKRFDLVGVRESGQHVNLALVDCGVTGLKVLTSTLLKKGEFLVIVPENKPESSEELPPRARVMWTRQPKETFKKKEVGLAFVLDTPGQRRCVSHFLLTQMKVGICSPQEHRGTPRVGGKMRCKVTTHDGPLVGVVKDIAPGGVLVTLATNIARKAEVKISVDLPTGNQPLESNGLVVRSIKTPQNEYDVAIAFTSIADAHRELLIDCLSTVMEQTRTEH